MSLTKDDLIRIGSVVEAAVEKKLRPFEGRVSNLEGWKAEHVRANGVASRKGLIAGIGGWLHGLTGWQRVAAIGVLGGVVLGVAQILGRLQGLL